MDIPSLPRYRGLDDGTPEPERHSLDQSFEASFAVVAAVAVVGLAGTFLLCWLIAGLVAAPAG